MWVGLAKRGLAKIVKNSYTNDQWFARGFYLSAEREAHGANCSNCRLIRSVKPLKS